jgi:hypothetical protein
MRSSTCTSFEAADSKNARTRCRLLVIDLRDILKGLLGGSVVSGGASRSKTDDVAGIQ